MTEQGTNHSEQEARPVSRVVSFVLPEQNAFALFEGEKMGPQTASNFVEPRLKRIAQGAIDAVMEFDVREKPKNLLGETNDHFREQQLEAGTSASVGFIWRSQGRWFLVAAGLGETGISLFRGSDLKSLKNPDKMALSQTSVSPTPILKELQKGDKIIVHPEVFRKLDRKRVIEDLRTLKYPSLRLLLMSQAKLKERRLPTATELIIIDVGDEITMRRFEEPEVVAQPPPQEAQVPHEEEAPAAEGEPAPEPPQPGPAEPAGEEPPIVTVPPQRRGSFLGRLFRRAFPQNERTKEDLLNGRIRRHREARRANGHREASFWRRTLTRRNALIVGAVAVGGGLGYIVGEEHTRKETDIFRNGINTPYGKFYPMYEPENLSTAEIPDDLDVLFWQHELDNEDYNKTGWQLLGDIFKADLGTSIFQGKEKNEILEKLARNGTKIVLVDSRLGTLAEAENMAAPALELSA